MTERELETQSLNCLKSKDYCPNSKVDNRGSRLLTFLYLNMLLYTYETKRMGKTTGDSIQDGMAYVEGRAFANTCGTVADRDDNSASSCSYR